MGGATDPDFTSFDWIIWRIEVRDPTQCAPDGVANATEAPARELASSLGCIFEYCTDDDSYDGTPEGTYYSWLLRVPRREHERGDEDGVPVAVAELHALLRSLLPQELQDWHVAVEQDLTLRMAANDALRGAYLDLLSPFEQALLPLGKDGAERIEPQPELWVADDEPAAGTYALCLCHDPGVGGHNWLVLYLGVACRRPFWESPTGARLLKRGVTADTPVLTIPRPADPTWMASLTTVGFSTERLPLGAAAARLAGARYQWTSNEIAALTDRVCSDLQALFPQIKPLHMYDWN